MMTARQSLAGTADGSWTQRVGACAEIPGLIRQLGAEPAALLRRAGLAGGALQDPDGRVPYDALCRLLDEAALETRCPHFGLLAGRTWHLANLGVVGELMRHSRTVRDALQTLTVHQHLNSGSGLAFLLERAGTVDLGYAIYQPGLTQLDQMYDMVMALAFNFLRELCPGWRPSQVLLPHASPADRRPYVALFKVQPTFNAEFSALRFPSQWMDRPIEGADPVRLANALRRISAAEGKPLLQQVFRALRLLLLHGATSGDDVAGMLLMHRRTLGRRLQAQGTTFHQLLDQVRLDVARQLLEESDIALDDIAATLGYSGLSTFMRTFRRWTGTTPGRWRRAASTMKMAAICPAPGMSADAASVA